MNKFKDYLKRVSIGVSIPIILYIILFIIAPDKAGGSVVISLLQQSIIPAILGWGLIFNLKAGLWDFSVGANVLFTTIMAGTLSEMLGLGNFGVILFCILFGLMFGSITGALFAWLKIPSIIVSVGMMLILESGSAVVFGGDGVVMHGDILALGSFPWNLIIGFVAFAISGILYNYKKFGHHIRAIGSNATVARFNGIKINSVRMRSFAVAGLFAGFYAILSLGGSGVAKPVTNMGTMGVVFNGIICGFIAIAIEKWVNATLGVIVGAITMKLILMIILAAGIPSTFQQVIIAIFLLLFMASKFQSEVASKISKKLFSRGSVNKVAAENTEGKE